MQATGDGRMNRFRQLPPVLLRKGVCFHGWTDYYGYLHARPDAEATAYQNIETAINANRNDRNTRLDGQQKRTLVKRL